MLCGIYLAEYARENWFNHGIRLVVDVLAGVPSIIVEVLVYELMVVPIGNNSAWPGAVAWGSSCARSWPGRRRMLKLVPKSLRRVDGVGRVEGADALMRVVLPASASGIITGVMLAVAHGWRARRRC